MIVRKLRLERGWSQETLAQVSGLNVRTIQRIERGQRAGLETLQALAAVFEVDVSDLTTELEMSESRDGGKVFFSAEEQQAMEYVRDVKAFYQHLAIWALCSVTLVFINLMTAPGFFWAAWPVFCWGFGVAMHGLSVHEYFNFLGPEWERRQVQKRLNRRE